VPSPKLALLVNPPLTLALAVAMIVFGVGMLVRRHQIVAYMSRRGRSNPTVVYTQVVLPSIGCVLIGLAIIALAVDRN
jgi:predicted Na+-dependent transporter